MLSNRQDYFPSDVEAERFVLGAVLFSDEMMHATRKMLEPDSFSVERHRKLWKGASGLYDEGKPVNPGTISMLLKEQRVYDDDLSFMASLHDGIAYSDGIDKYVQTVREKQTLRQLMVFADHITNRCTNGEKARDIVVEFQQRLLGMDKREGSKGLRSAAELVAEYGIVRLLQPRHERGLMSPWPWLNSVTHGFLPAELWVLAAHTSNGKTSAMMQHAIHAARHGKGVAIFSLEVGDISLFQKACCQMAGVNSDRMKAGRLTPDEMRLVNEAATELHDLPIYFDTGSTTVMAQHAEVRRLSMHHAVDQIIGDYLQLFANSGRHETRAQAVGANAWACKMMATDFQVPYLLLSQFSRPPKLKPGDPIPEPSLGDLKESGDVENHANGVWFIHRETMEDLDVVPVQFILPKQREGRRNIRKQMLFFGATQQFQEQTREEWSR